MAEAAISSVVQLLGEQVIQKVKFLQGVEEQVQLLKDELKRMQSFLIDANKKQADDERVRNWISEIRQLAQDAEDTIEMFLINVANGRNRVVLKCCNTFAKRMYHLDKIGDHIEKIQKRLEAINRSRETYGIKDLGEASESSRRANVESRRRLASWKKDEHLVGMEDHVKKLLRESILNEEKKGLSVAVVDGIGGIGKSTLAREIYNHPDVVVRFDCRGWVVVSSEFTPQEMLKQLILELPGSDQQEIRRLEESTTDKLYVQEKLREMLGKQIEGKSYFIVLDDVWEENHWEFLRDAFPNQQGKTSRLLITTRNKAISKYCQYAHEMEKLDPEKSWELLLKKAFIDGKCPKELENIGREILEKCNGLPLAISTIGGLLVGTQSKSRWEEVLKQVNSLLGSAESTVSAILELSYLNLPPQLKSCFLCLAFFKEDATIPTIDLVHIWISQCLIQQQEGRTLEETARDYLDELINRNMVEVKDWTMDDRVNQCHLHDLIRDVCVRRAKEEIGFHVLKEEKGISSESLHKPRHSTVQCAVDLGDFLLNQSNHLRSLFLLDDCSCLSTRSPHWKSFQLLKILYFDSLDHSGTLPDSFRGLIGLKYLRIRISFYPVLELPSWLGDLKKLEVLDMDGMDIIKLPKVPLKMESLRYFSAFCVMGLKRIDKWQNIETLCYIRQDDWRRCSSRLMDSCRLRELGIHQNSRKGREELSKMIASLGKLKNLVTLHLKSCNDDILFDLAHLSNLTKLSLSGYVIMKCPAASTFPPNISYLTMDFVMFDKDPMLELGKLPKLEFLELYRDYSCERIQVLHDGFPCLKAFTLGHMTRLTVIDIEEGGMPYLRQLRIKNCPLLETQNLPEHVIVSVM